MAELITDELVETFAIEAAPAELCSRAQEIYGGVADRVVLPLEYSEAYMG